MATAAAPIRLDRELAAAARDAAQTMSRSVAEQVSHWARLGRELERSPGVSVAQVQAVLRGSASYDALNVQEQAVVRATWDEQLAATLATLDLSEAFATEGHRYAELDAHGQLRVVDPR
jgi:alkylhydroperoxidase family enzyme